MPRNSTSAPAVPGPRLSHRAGFLLAQLGTHRHRRFAELLADLDLHPRHFGLLSHISAGDGQSQQALSIALGIHRSAMVALVDDLESRGLAVRRANLSDRRAHMLHLTPHGRKTLRKLERIAAEDEDDLLSDLDQGERSQLISLLQRVAESEGLLADIHPDLEPKERERLGAQGLQRGS